MRLIFLFLLSLVLSFPALAEDNDKNWTIKRAAIKTALTELIAQFDDCNAKYNGDEFIAKNKVYDKKLVADLDNKRLACYQQVASHAFTRLYPETKDKMQQDFDAFIEQTKKMHHGLYMNNTFKVDNKEANAEAQILETYDILSAVGIYISAMFDYTKQRLL